MNDEARVFIDTNVLMYAYSCDETAKRLVVQKLLKSAREMVISTQVVNEFVNVMHKKRDVPIAILKDVVCELESSFMVSLVTLETIRCALEISEIHKYSYFDSLIVASAIENLCSVLYSEDMHNTHVVNKILSIQNPFA